MKSHRLSTIIKLLIITFYVLNQVDLNRIRLITMTYVVTENCIKCKLTDCVDVCPVDCFHEGPNFLIIDPDECIDCQLCVPECPVEAIYEESDLPEDQYNFIQLNADLAKIWPVIDTVKPGMPDADKWDGVPGKLKYLENRHHHYNSSSIPY